MRLDFLLLSDRAEAINGKLYLMGGGFDRVAVSQLPGTASYDIALGFLVPYNETNERHTFTVRLETQDNEIVASPDGRRVEVGGQFEVGRPPGLIAGQDQRVIVVVRGPFPAPAAGVFGWVPLIDGREFERTRFAIEQASGASMPPANPMPD
jgi:hypothetical protein